MGMHGMGGMGMRYGYMSGLGSSWMVLAMIVFWILAFVAVFFIVRYFINSKDKKHDAQEVLKIRLAKGEITEEEYLKLKDILSK